MFLRRDIWRTVAINRLQAPTLLSLRDSRPANIDVQNSTRLLYLPIPSSAETWKIFTNKLCQFFFAKADILSEKNPYFGTHLFCKTRTDYVQDFGTGKNFRFNQYHNKEFLSFFSVKVFYKSNRKLFSCVCIAWYNHSRAWENYRQLCKPSTSSRVCTTVSNSPTPLVFISGYANKENVFYCLNISSDQENIIFSLLLRQFNLSQCRNHSNYLRSSLRSGYFKMAR